MLFNAISTKAYYSKNDPRIVFLNHLINDIETLNPDTCSIIDGYLNKTGIDTKIVSIFAALREEINNNQSNELYNNCKNEFIEIIKDRVGLLRGKNIVINDRNLWLLFATQQKKFKEFAQLERFGSQWQDLLFECKVTIQTRDALAVNRCCDDLNNSLASLSKAFEVLEAAAKKSKKFKSVIDNIETIKEQAQEMVCSLSKNLKSGEFEKAKNTLNDLKKLTEI